MKNIAFDVNEAEMQLGERVKHAVARVAEAWEDEALFAQLGVDVAHPDLEPRHGFRYVLETLLRGEYAEELDLVPECPSQGSSGYTPVASSRRKQ